MRLQSLVSAAHRRPKERHLMRSTTHRRRVRYLWLGTLAVVATLAQPASTAAAGQSVLQVGAQAANGINRPQGITAGPDGALWFTNQGNNSIGRITTGGNVTKFTGNGISGPDGITAGPDGALWFTNYNNNSIGRITTGGNVTNFTHSGIDGPQQITAGPDKALWFTDYDNSPIGRITTGGNVTIFTNQAIDRALG